MGGKERGGRHCLPGNGRVRLSRDGYGFASYHDDVPLGSFAGRSEIEAAMWSKTMDLGMESQCKLDAKGSIKGEVDDLLFWCLMAGKSCDVECSATLHAIIEA